MKPFKSDVLHNIRIGYDYFDNLSPVKRDELKVMFHYGDAQSNKDIVFAEAYDQWAAVKQCDFIKNGRLQVVLMQLNSDLSLDAAHKRYLHSSQIETLDLQFESYGFSGSIRFKIPYDLTKETLWSDLLLANNLLAIQIRYQEDKLESAQYKVNENTVWEIQGYIDVSQGKNRNLSDKMSIYPYESKTEHYLGCNLSFIDAFTFISKQHFPVEVYTQQGYSQIFKNVFDEWDALLSLKMGKGLAAFESIRPWVCLNCHYPEISFYDLFYRTLSHYQYQFRYDYSQLKPTYNIIDITQLKRINKQVKLEEGVMTEIIWKPSTYHFANIHQSNHHWSDQSMADSSTINNTLFPQAPIRRDVLSYCPTSQQFKNIIGSNKSQSKYDLDHQNCFWTTFRCFSSEVSLLPANQFVAPEEYKNKLGSSSDAFEVETIKINFKNKDVQAIYAGQISTFTVTPTSKEISHIDYALQHGIKIQAKVFLSDKPQLVFPEYNKKARTLQVYGWITDFNDSNKDLTYFLTAGNGQDPMDITSGSIANDHDYTPMYCSSESQLSYVIKLPKKALFSANNISKTFTVNLAYFSMQDHQVIPLRKDTPVMIHLDQESGRIDSVMWHSLQDKTINKDIQVNKMTFGANDGAGIEYTAPKKLDDPRFKIFAKTSQNNTEIIADKKAIRIVYRRRSTTEDK